MKHWKRLRKKTQYQLIALLAVSLCTLTTLLLLTFFQSSITFNIEDKSTITLKHEVDTLPVINAEYKATVFTKEPLSLDVTMSGDLDISKIGTYHVTYTASHGRITESVEQTIIVEDASAPIISLKKNSKGKERMIIDYGSTFKDPGVTAYDSVDGDVTSLVVSSGSINTKIFGEQYITYIVSDSHGNTATAQRIVVVKETEAPTLNLKGDTTLYHNGDEPFKDPGYSAKDNADGNITENVKISGKVDTNTAGKYTLSYTITDSSGNSTKKSRTVYVYKPQTSEQIANPPGKIVYLTFDDGPGPYTEQLLDILDKYNVNVTFFVTNQYSDYQDMIGEAYRRGHTIAIHTYSHKFSRIYTSESAYYKDLNKMSAICEKQTGEKPTIVRFPGGTSNTVSKKYCSGIMTTLSKSLTKNGYQYCDWNVDSGDAGSATTTSEVAKNVIRDIQDFSRSVVLQHDTKQYSVEAVEEILKWGLSHGYTFLPLTPETQMFHHKSYN